MAEKNIPFIHNYCDRWCERCAFTTRCAVFQQEQRDSSAEGADANNKLFWEKLSQNVSRAKSKLEEIAEKAGIDLNELNRQSEETEETRKQKEKLSQEHALKQLSIDYDNSAREWLSTQPGMLNKLERLKEELTLGVENEESVRIQTQTIKDSLAVINWYTTLIHTKLMRALMGKYEDDNLEEFLDDIQNDNNGSAKVALIGIERSMEAWMQIFNLLPENEDHFLNVLSMLERMKKITLEEFPHAMAFTRPGFDDHPAIK